MYAKHYMMGRIDIQHYVVSILAEGGSIWMLDRGNGYQRLARDYAGSTIHLTLEHPINLNPFAFVRDINEAMPVLTALLLFMASPMVGHTREARVVLEQAIHLAWRHHQHHTSIDDLLASLKTCARQVSQSMERRWMMSLLPYTEGMKHGYFASPDLLVTDNRLTVLSLDALGPHPILQELVFALLLTRFASLTGDKESHVCLIDELWGHRPEPKMARLLRHIDHYAAVHRGMLVTTGTKYQGLSRYDAYASLPEGEMLH